MGGMGVRRDRHVPANEPHHRRLRRRAKGMCRRAEARLRLDDAGDLHQWAQSLVLINPGETNKLLMKAPDGSLVPVTFTKADQGFAIGPKRRYLARSVAGHAWDSKWFGKFDYVWSKTWGNDEGPVSTYSQQSGSYESLTTAWDFPERMDYSNGILPNSRKHQFKIYGAYQIIPDWTVGANVYIPPARRACAAATTVRQSRCTVPTRITAAACRCRRVRSDSAAGPRTEYGPGLQPCAGRSQARFQRRGVQRAQQQSRCSITMYTDRPTVPTRTMHRSRIRGRRAASDSPSPTISECSNHLSPTPGQVPGFFARCELCLVLPWRRRPRRHEDQPDPCTPAAAAVVGRHTHAGQGAKGIG